MTSISDARVSDLIHRLEQAGSLGADLSPGDPDCALAATIIKDMCEQNIRINAILNRYTPTHRSDQNGPRSLTVADRIQLMSERLTVKKNENVDSDLLDWLDKQGDMPQRTYELWSTGTPLRIAIDMTRKEED